MVKAEVTYPAPDGRNWKEKRVLSILMGDSLVLLPIFLNCEVDSSCCCEVGVGYADRVGCWVVGPGKGGINFRIHYTTSLKILTIAPL